MLWTQKWTTRKLSTYNRV